MKKIKFLTMGLAVTTVFLTASCNPSDKEADKTETALSEDSIYACPMHPEVTSDAPGTCPKCNMNLEKMSKKEHEELHKQMHGDEAHGH